ncbi:MAG: phospho-sugar mutase [Candidatus Sumerlaeia bacterium]|nr:phospho-sugar mutase [Candidatus Sumerlaeia bacterium]
MALSFSSPEIAERVREWTSEAYDKETRAEIQALVDAGNVAELEDRFYRTLEFGTGGLRGVLGAGTNRMNPTVVARATQGLANYVRAHAEKPGPLRAAIAHDCRNFSREFAETVAGVLAANDIIVHVSPELRPTPYLSFAVRRLECHIGIVVTASHNPKEYNGYKVYWDDGSQVVPPHDKGIVAEVNKISSNDQVQRLDFQQAIARGLVHVMDEEMDHAYLEAVAQQCLDREAIRSNPVKIVYTPLHGAGGTLCPQALRQWGFTDVYPEEEQMRPDGAFPTAASPNPEEGKALERAIALAGKVGAELVLATDPDADRLGIAVRHEGEYRLMTGNQLGALMCDYLLARRRELGTLPAKPAVCTTIVTTPLFPEVAAHHGARCPLVLTGFKWIAKAARDLAAEDAAIEFLYGTEESYGYLIGRHAMDKDGIVASCVTAEMAAWCKGRGKTLVDYLEELYLRHEPRIEWQKSVTMPGREGGEKIRGIMRVLQDAPPREIAGLKVTRRTRVDTGEVFDGQTGAVVGRLDLPSSNVVTFDLEDGSRAIGRPSGTEPKIKFYFFLAGPKQKDIAGVRAALAALEKRRPEFEKAFLTAIGC